MSTTELAPTPESDAMVAAAMSRQASEVQSAMVIAKKFPRDTTRAIAKIVTACNRVGLAEAAEYTYPRGGMKVTGPSIRLAEALAQNWGNVDFGLCEMEQRNGESTVMAYAWDLETNTRQTKVFQVPHVRETKKGRYPLTDSRDIYEHVANQGARRMRACILGIIPGDVQDLAIAECRHTLESAAGGEPLTDRIAKMSKTFADKYKVSKEQLETRLGHVLDSCTEGELVTLRGIYTSLKDGMSKVEDWFPKTVPEAKSLDDVTERLTKKGKQDDDKPLDLSAVKKIMAKAKTLDDLKSIYAAEEPGVQLDFGAKGVEKLQELFDGYAGKFA
jgi:hypothetical protein